MGDEGGGEIRTMGRQEGDFGRQIGRDVMSNIRELGQSQRRAGVAAPFGIARIADQVCEATRQFALDEVAFALSVVAEQSPAPHDVIHDQAGRVLARATLMQFEIDRFLAVSRASQGLRAGCGRADARAEPSARRNKMALTALEARRTTCHGGPLRDVFFK